MSIAGNTPYYILATKRPDGMIDYTLMNPRGWGADEVIHVGYGPARDEEQAFGRIQNYLPPWQSEIEFIYESFDHGTVVNLPGVGLVVKRLPQETTTWSFARG